ncbi:MAG TPA: hypothetical protein VF777_02025 [Phycisphaerales bacterium]
MTEPSDSSAFYVGYLPTPRPLVRFLRVFVPVTLWTLATVATLISATATDPGPAVWNDGRAQTFRGTLVRWPYPMLIERGGSHDGSENAARSARLLIETGKRGVSRPLDALDGRPVVISGWTLERSGQRMVELEPDAAALAADERAAAPDLGKPVPLGMVTLRGEIVDSKCYLGAMKPGNEKPHKACATLCIRGGVPPVLIERDADGTTRATLLADAGGGPLGAEAWEYVADPIEIRGELETWAGIRRLRVTPGSIRRL